MANIKLNSVAEQWTKSNATNNYTGYFTKEGGKVAFEKTAPKNYIGSVTKSDDVYTYKPHSSGMQSISGIGKDAAWKIDYSALSAGGYFSFAESGKASSVIGGNGNDTVNAKNAATGSYFDLKNGADVVSFAKGATIDLGAGNDSVYGSKGSNEITLGAGNDYVQVADEDTVKAGTGNNVIDVTATNERTVGTVSVTNYKYATDIISVGSGMTKLYADTKAASAAFLSTGRVVSKGNSTVAFAEASSYWVTLQDNKKNTQTVVFAGEEEGTTITASGTTKNLIMVGNNNDSGQYLIGGSGKDTIYAGEGDSVDGGAGNDSIILAGHNDRIYVGIKSNGGKDTVTGFTGGFEDSSDVVYFFDGINKANAKVTSNGLTITDGKATLIVDAATDGDSGAYKVLGMDSAGTVKKIAIAGETSGGTIKATEVDEYYVGKKAAVDFSTVNDDVQIDLGNTGRWTTGSPTFSGIVAATGADNGTNRLVGAAGTKNTLQGGANGENSIYGGGTASDSLVGGSSAADVFFYGTGNGKDTISGYESENDVVAIWGGATGGSRDANGNVKVKWQDGQTLTITGITSANETIYYSYRNGASSTGLRVGQTDQTNIFEYADDVSIYWGGKQGDTLQITGTDDVKAWLDGSHGVLYNGINALDAQQASGAVELAGSAKADSIVGGSGDNSLWGGFGVVSDTLTGGTGQNTFYFGMGDGKDVITASNDGDKVMLYNVAFENIVGTPAVNDSGAMVINLSDGSRLTIENYTTAGASTFQLTDGTYTYDKTDKTWTKA